MKLLLIPAIAMAALLLVSIIPITEVGAVGESYQTHINSAYSYWQFAKEYKTTRGDISGATHRLSLSIDELLNARNQRDAPEANIEVITGIIENMHDLEDIWEDESDDVRASDTRTAVAPAGAGTAAFIIGQRVVTTTRGGNVNIRNSPERLETNIIGQQPPGSVGTVTEGPQTASGHTWWNVDYNTGVDGWTAGEYLRNLEEAAAESASDVDSADAGV